MDIEQNLMLFQELIRCGGDVYTWIYDGEGNLLRSNCPDEALFATAFSALGEKERMLEHGRESEAPMILGNTIGMNWGISYHWEAGTLAYCCVIGPVFYYDASMREVEWGLHSFPALNLSAEWIAQFISALGRIPLAQNIVFFRYTLMLHYCLTGQHLGASDLTVQRTIPTQLKQQQGRDRLKVWLAEQAMLQMVRTGDLNYKEALNASVLSSAGVPVQGKDPLRQAKTSNVVFTSIVCRAAIEGGLSPEEAYALGDAYIQSSESAKRYEELSGIAMTMYDDFVHRVHMKRSNPKYSPQIRQCCEYIEMHLDEKIRAADLAKLVGYTEYYLTHKFKQETGSSVNDYAKFAKIERAKVLLKTSDDSIQTIADRLGFSSRSYFSRVFAEVVGCTPVEFRVGREISRG